MEVEGVGSPPPTSGIEMIKGAKGLADLKAGLEEVQGTAVSNGRRITNNGDLNGSQGSLAVKDLIAKYKELNQSKEAKPVSEEEKAEIILRILHLDAEASESFDEASTVSKAILAFKQAFSGVKHKQFKEMISGLDKQVGPAYLDTMQVYLAARKVGKNRVIPALGVFTVMLKTNSDEERKMLRAHYSESLNNAESKKLNELFFKEIEKAQIDENGEVAQALKAMKEEVTTAPNPADRPQAPNPPAQNEGDSDKDDEGTPPPLLPRDAPTPQQRAKQQAAERGQAPEPPSVNKPEGPNGSPPALPQRPRTFTRDPQSMNPPTPPKSDVG